jgi:hypothetical protein
MRRATSASAQAAGGRDGNAVRPGCGMCHGLRGAAKGFRRLAVVRRLLDCYYASVSTEATSGDSSGNGYSTIKTWWTCLTIALSLLTYGLGSFLQRELEPFFSVWQIAWVTLPLTLTVALISFLLFIKKLTFWRMVVITWAAFAASVVTGTTAGRRVSAYLSVAHSRWVGPKTCSPVGPINFCLPDFSKGHLVTSHPHQHFPIVDYILAYLNLYGWIGGIKALLVGCFLGYVFLVIYRTQQAST